MPERLASLLRRRHALQKKPAQATSNFSRRDDSQGLVEKRQELIGSKSDKQVGLYGKTIC